jgi:hypothetical protein
MQMLTLKYSLWEESAARLIACGVLRFLVLFQEVRTRFDLALIIWVRRKIER